MNWKLGRKGVCIKRGCRCVDMLWMLVGCVEWKYGLQWRGHVGDYAAEWAVCPTVTDQSINHPEESKCEDKGGGHSRMMYQHRQAAYTLVAVLTWRCILMGKTLGWWIANRLGTRPDIGSSLI